MFSYISLVLLFSLYLSTHVLTDTSHFSSYQGLIHSIKKQSIDDFANALRRRLDHFKQGDNKQVELIFLIDGSSSVGETNFESEVKFVGKLVADLIVGPKNVRVAVVVFDSKVTTYVNHLDDGANNEKCSLLHHELVKVRYTGGNTYTLGAMQEASAILTHSRPNAKKVVFLITDGFSNNGDPVPVAAALKLSGAKIFAFGIKTGNINELFRMSSPPSEEHAFFLESFSEFEALARRALHEDLGVGVYTAVNDAALCSNLCESNATISSCCNANATCSCGSLSGHFSCLCPAGYFGNGLISEPCLPCPMGTYHDGRVPGDISVCRNCPGRNQNTKKFPATSIDDCICEDGFIPLKNSCTVITCPKLSSPKNGYFVKENCSNVLNAACGVRCNIGYELIGSSVRICQKNGTWTGDQPICQPKKCSELKPVDFGEVLCKHEDEGFEILVDYGVGGVRKREIIKQKLNEYKNITSIDKTNLPVDTECHFECPLGFNLIGSKVRTCLPITRWNGLQATCKPITCPALPRITNGRITPANCTQRGLRHGYGAICSNSCEPGFHLKGNSTRLCTGKHGTWTGKGQVYKCVDVEPPKFACPGNMSATTLPDSFVASVDISLPAASDNSGITPILWIEPNVTFLPVGVHQFSIHGEDASGNSAACSFWFHVKDTEKPKMKNCSSLPPMSLSDLLQLDFEEPSFYDNSGNVSVIKSHHDSPINGTMLFNYTAVDPYGNSETCLINATLLDFVCSEPPPETHTEVNCSTVEGVASCHVYCKSGYASLINNITVTCYNGRWVADASTVSPWLNCSEIVSAKELGETGEMLVITDKLCGSDSERNLQEFTNQIFAMVEDDNLTLVLDCKKSAMEELTNIVSRKRRSTEPRKNKINFEISGSWRIYQKYFYKSDQTPGELLKKKMFNNTSLTINGKPVEVESVVPLGEFVTCHDGSIPVRNLCVKCGAGNFFEVSKKTCRPCHVGSYQQLEGTLECSKCPYGTTTLRQGRTSLRDCKRICQDGSYSARVNSAGVSVAPCWPCPRGQHQPLEGQTSCVSCWRSPSEKCRSIREPCLKDTCKNNGSCSHTGSSLCICKQGYFGNYCDEHFNPCDSSPCLSGGTCLYEGLGAFSCSCAPGFYGQFCEREINHCVPDLCRNNGLCTSTADGFHCNCVDAYIGNDCNGTIDTCSLLHPCVNNGTCTNLPGGKFHCRCAYQYSGTYCEKFLGCLSNEEIICNQISENISPCTGSGCSMKTTVAIDEGSVLSFAKGTTSDYLFADMDYPQFGEISACLWVQTSDRLNFGTLFSFASEYNDNEFTLTDYNGLVLYVRGQRVVTDVVINDGFWHYICVSWETTSGSWKIYQDGKVAANGSNLAAGLYIHGKGTLVVGQDQDFPGGGFNPVESFVGKLSRFHVWRTALTDSVIANLADSCDSPSVGQILDVGLRLLRDARGNIGTENSTFCKSCGEPPSIFRSDVLLEGSVAKYECHEGFLIKFPDDPTYQSRSNWTRKCQISGEWQPNPPICARVSCGFPGFLPRGSITGRSYLYEDTIRYNCKDGYDLFGPKWRTCRSNGTWSGVKPYCKEKAGKVLCPVLSPPRRGALFLISSRHDHYGDSMPGDRAEFTCDVGYKVTGTALLTCLPQGMWSDTTPECAPCDTMPDPC